MSTLATIDVQMAADRLRRALECLAENDATLRLAIERVGYPAPRIQPAGFATLLRIIVAQQVSTRAAATIQRRVELAMGERVEAQVLLDLPVETLRGCGLSGRKVVYARELAAAIVDGRLNLERLAAAPDEEVVSALTALPGFGRWSAEIYLLFALQRQDVLPADDLALQIAAQRLKNLEVRPNARDLRALAVAWSPWRGAASVFLWHYYGAATLDSVA
jgi:DNA-3-methyladenine glycosylase II